MEQVKWFKESATFVEEIRLWKWWFGYSDCYADPRFYI